jgi:selenide,water dikinase
VGFDTSDDAGVYRLDAEHALVQTVDFIPPPVEDARMYGQIAAANSLSDVYAMGGTPLTALNLVCFPDKVLPEEMLHAILQGGGEKILEAGATLVGGHSIRDDEPKYGLSVTGMVHPDRIWRNIGAKPGDALILTKAIGTGALFNANRRDGITPAAYEALVSGASRLNRYAAEAVGHLHVHAATDVTGFGLGGHATEMAIGVRFRIQHDAIPVLPGARDAMAAGISTGANAPNRAHCGDRLQFKAPLGQTEQQLHFDPQTSGGLLLALPSSEADEALARIRSGGDAGAVVIGEVLEGSSLVEIV